jgi:hypothetical protein
VGKTKQEDKIRLKKKKKYHLVSYSKTINEEIGLDLMWYQPDMIPIQKKTVIPVYFHCKINLNLKYPQ